MDKASEVVSSMNARVLKEPRGLLRIILAILAIFAFATTCSSSGRSSFSVNCPDPTLVTRSPVPYEYSVGYPFKIDETVVDVTNCSGSSMMIRLYGNFSPPSQFFVFVGVMAFLYSLATLVLFIFFDEKYRQFDKIPLADFVISVVFVLLWLISSSAWSQGVSDLKFYTNPSELMNDDPMLKSVCMRNNEKKYCTVISHSQFPGLNVSLIFGFLNMVVWIGNLWFLWKETSWFKARESATKETTTSTPQQEEPRF